MISFAISIASLVVGVIITFWIARYYFRRSKKKSLTPYIQFSSSVFDGVDYELRDSLSIEYKGVTIKNLYEIQFLIANTGERAIRDLIDPLTLHIPDGTQILDASIIHIHPLERKVTIDIQDPNIIFQFSLLNGSEFFIAKILLDGMNKIEDFKFSISVDDIPPTLTSKPLPFELIDTGESTKFDKKLLILGVILTLLGVGIAGLIFGHWSLISSLWESEFLAVLKNNWIVLLSVLVSALPGLLFLVFGPILFFGSFNTGFSFPKKRKFAFPQVHNPFYLQPPK